MLDDLRHFRVPRRFTVDMAVGLGSAVAFLVLVSRDFFVKLLS